MTLTLAQIWAILSLLRAFGADPFSVTNVQNILIPTATTTAYVQVIQTPIVESQPVYFGSTPVNNPASTSMPVVQSVVMPTNTVPNWTINAKITDRNGVEKTSYKTTDMVRVEVSVFDKNGAYQKVPVTVTTNDPDFSDSSFVINQPGQGFLFCVAPHTSPFVNNGCPIENPVTTGTFDFTFTVEEVSIIKQITIQ